jgi:phosphatidylglycerol:prolipoprotein diacylglycerol transferase
MPFATVVIDLNPNVLKLGPVLITWHGVFSVIGILAAVRLAQHLIRRHGESPQRISEIAVWMVVFGVVGARGLYVWENYRLFIGEWQRIFLLNEGGISQWGGIFGALSGGYIWCRRTNVDFRVVLDVAGPANALGFAIGRIGDVINGEHHAIGSNLPWAVSYVNSSTLGVLGKPVHPEVAYELIWNLLVCAGAVLTYDRLRRRLPSGVTGLIWLSAFAIGRFTLDFLREDQIIYGLRQAQWASLLMVVIAVPVSFYWLSRRRRDALDLSSTSVVP